MSPSTALRLPEVAPPGAGEIVVVLADLQAWSAEAEAWTTVLSPEEKTRADRFVTPALRQAFVVAHGFLRGILGACLRCPPEALSFAQHGRGKPFLVEGPGALAFNLSHTRHHVAVAVGEGVGAVGVDIEDQGRAVTPALIDACTTPSERALCAEAPTEAARRALFYRLWTRKEALLKAAGIGMGVPLAGLEVAPTSPHATLLLRGDGNGPAATTSPFTAESLSGLPTTLSGALACAGTRLPPWRLLILHP